MERPQHRRNASSKSGILKSLVSSKARPADLKPSRENAHQARSQTVPILPPDHLHGSSRGGGLKERAGNVQSPPTSPSKKKATFGRNDRDNKTSKAKDAKDFKKSKSSTNLGAVFAKMNRSSKDLSAQVSKDKENRTPPVSAHQPSETPIFAQFSSKIDPNSSRPDSRGSKSSNNLQSEIDLYTPKVYSPSKQRNFNGTADEPGMRPTLGRDRPKSAYYAAQDGFIASLGRRASGRQASLDEKRRSEDAARKQIPVQNGRVSMERSRIQSRASMDRKTSGSSTEAPAKEKLNVTKRGGRVMAAVAAFQGKMKETPAEQTKKEEPLDPKTVDAAFEAVLESRNIPEPMRQKMRTLTLRVKADFIKQDKTSTSPPGTLTNSLEKSKSSTKVTEVEPEKKKEEDDSKSTKRSRTRSRTFTWSKGDKKNKGEASPSKKQRSQSKSRPNSVEIPKEAYVNSKETPTPPTGSFGRKSGTPATPADYISYLKKNQDPTKVEVGRLHKLRILLRNETVTWVDGFISQGGMSEIVELLSKTMAVEWREDHEDQVLHEGLLCLKGLCTTERALAELNKVADDLFPALLGMLFDEEKKGPAEYTTRTIIINVLCK